MSGFAVFERRPSEAYALSSTGLLRSRDGGASWDDISPRPLTTWGTVLADPRRPGVVYHHAPYGPARRSDDHGNSWEALPTPYLPDRLRIDPADSTRLYLLPELFVSEDDGHTWFPAGAGLPAGGRDVVADPARPGSLLLIDEEGMLYRTRLGVAR